MCLRVSLVPCMILLTAVRREKVSIPVFFWGSMEPLAVGSVFASQNVLSPLSEASALMPTTFTLVIETSMKMGMSSQTCLAETINHSNQFYHELFENSSIFMLKDKAIRMFCGMLFSLALLMRKKDLFAQIHLLMLLMRILFYFGMETTS